MFAQPQQVITGYRNSLYITIVGTVLNDPENRAERSTRYQKYYSHSSYRYYGGNTELRK